MLRRASARSFLASLCSSSISRQGAPDDRLQLERALTGDVSERSWRKTESLSSSSCSSESTELFPGLRLKWSSREMGDWSTSPELFDTRLRPLASAPDALPWLRGGRDSRGLEAIMREAAGRWKLTTSLSSKAPSLVRSRTERHFCFSPSSSPATRTSAGNFPAKPMKSTTMGWLDRSSSLPRRSRNSGSPLGATGAALPTLTRTTSSPARTPALYAKPLRSRSSTKVRPPTFLRLEMSSRAMLLDL
mmetsp:Transcript_7458/g.20995  ORF Transcript_7458/g.20995 Transcript_7458/m.20995 type:complete len:247 (-) Transcript_7458:782-1522(-)